MRYPNQFLKSVLLGTSLIAAANLPAAKPDKKAKSTEQMLKEVAARAEKGDPVLKSDLEIKVKEDFTLPATPSNGISFSDQYVYQNGKFIGLLSELKRKSYLSKEGANIYKKLENGEYCTINTSINTTNFDIMTRQSHLGALTLRAGEYFGKIGSISSKFNSSVSQKSSSKKGTETKVKAKETVSRVMYLLEDKNIESQVPGFKSPQLISAQSDVNAKVLSLSCEGKDLRLSTISKHLGPQFVVTKVKSKDDNKKPTAKKSKTKKH